MAKNYQDEADRQDRLAAAKYAASVSDPNYLICRGTGRHVPVAINRQMFDDLIPLPDGGRIGMSHCMRCGLPCKKTFDRNWYRVTGWIWLYNKHGDGDYLARKGEGLGLTSTAARQEFERFLFAGVPEVDHTAPKARKPRKRRAS